jgi:hypothetical protein
MPKTASIKPEQPQTWLRLTQSIGKRKRRASTDTSTTQDQSGARHNTEPVPTRQQQQQQATSNLHVGSSFCARTEHHAPAVSPKRQKMIAPAPDANGSFPPVCGSQGGADEQKEVRDITPADGAATANSCNCHLEGCVLCHPRRYHAAHCGSSACMDCAIRPPGFDFWKQVPGEQVDADLYTPGVASLAKSYDGEQNVLVLVLSELVTKAMKGSVVEGRRYRALKTELDAELSQIMDDSQPAWDAYMNSLTLVKNKRYDMRRQNYRPTHEQLGELRTLKADF